MAKNYKTKENFLWIAEKLIIEVWDTDGIITFGLKWGEGVIGDMLGISRKTIIGGLDWADNNTKEAKQILHI